jgi:hypothetical protein
MVLPPSIARTNYTEKTTQGKEKLAEIRQYDDNRQFNNPSDIVALSGQISHLPYSKEVARTS